MIRDITIGQYYAVDSPIHRLDPRTKLAGTFLYLIGLFLAKDFYGFIAAIVFFAGVVFLSKVPFSYICRGLKPIFILLFFTVIFNIFFTNGRVLVKWHFIRITYEGIYRAVFMAIRLVLLILGTSIMTFTTTPTQLTDGLERAMKPLKLIHFPVHDLAMMMSIALRFIPILLEETDKIMKAQQARGADFESGNLIRRAKALIPIFIPLIVSAFRRAFDLAMAMEARCYRGDVGRTKLHPLCYKRRDAVAYFCMLLFVIAVILLRIWG